MDIQKADQHFIHTYNRKITFVKGEGMYLIDDTGRKYLDMGALRLPFLPLATATTSTNRH